MDQEIIHYPNVTPSSYSMKFWGLFGMEAHLPHTTQQNFVIGEFAKMNTIHWLRHLWQYINQYPLSPDDISTT